MKNLSPLPEDKKITVVIRVEPGCLGPDGKDNVEEFCSVAQIEIEPIDSYFVNWEVVPRFDKSLRKFSTKQPTKY